MVRRELTLRLANSPGSLASACQLLGDERVNILAMSLVPGGHLHLIVDNPTRAVNALRARHHKVMERDVIVISSPASAGSIAPLLKLLSAAGINVEYAYASQAEGASSAAFVVGVENAQHAAAATGL